MNCASRCVGEFLSEGRKEGDGVWKKDEVNRVRAKGVDEG